MRRITLILSCLLLFARILSARSLQPDPCALLTPARIGASVGLELGKMAINTKKNPARGTLCDVEFFNAGAGGITVSSGY
jgi:hypothetical protein